MKAILGAIFFLISGFLAPACAQSRKSIGIHYSFPAGSTLFTLLKVEGAGSYEGRSMHNFGVSYIHGLSRILSLETGLEYAAHQVLHYPAFTGENRIQPIEKRVKILTAPVLAQINLGDYIYLNAGPLFDLDLSKPRQTSNQTGIGIALGVGGRYIFMSGFSIFAHPIVRVHGIIPFSTGSINYHVAEAGIRLGMAYTFVP